MVNMRVFVDQCVCACRCQGVGGHSADDTQGDIFGDGCSSAEARRRGICCSAGDDQSAIPSSRSAVYQRIVVVGQRADNVLRTGVTDVLRHRWSAAAAHRTDCHDHHLPRTFPTTPCSQPATCHRRSTSKEWLCPQIVEQRWPGIGLNIGSDSSQS